jgi:hypothetical protein
MSEKPARCLTGEEVGALRFAAHRQLSRWADKASLNDRQHAQRAALRRAVRTLQDGAFEHGCELRPVRAGGA